VSLDRGRRSPRRLPPDLAGALNTQAGALAGLGRARTPWPRSPKPSPSAGLASQYPVFVPDGARSLILQGLLRTELSDLVGALSADREAVSLYATFSEADAALYRDQYTALLPTIEEVSGSTQPDTLTARANLARSALASGSE
jgi:hypothetical protein